MGLQGQGICCYVLTTRVCSVNAHIAVSACVCLTEHFMSQFFIVPYSLLPGHNAKTVQHISAEHCAQLCVYDDTIVCRSFDYHVSHSLDNSLPCIPRVTSTINNNKLSYRRGTARRAVTVKTVLNVAQMFVELHLISHALRE